MPFIDRQVLLDSNTLSSTYSPSNHITLEPNPSLIFGPCGSDGLPPNGLAPGVDLWPRPGQSKLSLGTFAGIVGKETLSLSEKAGTEEQVSLELSMPVLPTQGEN